MNLIKILFALHLKYSSIWASGDVKHAYNNLVHAMPQQCMFALYMCIL